MNYFEVHSKAIDYGKTLFPEAPVKHHNAFANACVYAVLGMFMGIGGPSMRELLACTLVTCEKGKGAYTLEESFELLLFPAYGEITIKHALILLKWKCFDDTEEDHTLAKTIVQRHKNQLFAEPEHVLLGR